MNERQIFKAAGVSLREANAAKADLLDRLYDFLSEPDYDPSLTDEILAWAAEAISEVTDPDYEGFDPEAHALFLKHEAKYQALALIAQQTAEAPGVTLSLQDMANLSGLPLERLEEAYEALRPDLTKAESTKPGSAKAKKKLS